MDIIPLDGTTGHKWNEFCLKSSNAWFWHTTYWMDYVVEYKPELQPVQMSFFVNENNKCLAICPLMIENRNGIKEFSFSSFAVPAPAILNGIENKKRYKIYDYIFSYVDHMAKSHDVRKSSFRFSPLSNACSELRDDTSSYLLRYGYLDATFNTQIINTSQDLEHIRGDIRKGHKYDIKKASNTMDVHIFDAASIDLDIFDLYRQLHHKDAGRITRPLSTFNYMYDWVKKGYGILAGAAVKGKDKFIGFSYHTIYKGGAYYSSACSDPDFNELPIAHILLWESIRWMHGKGMRRFEVGWQFYGSEFHYHTSQKENNISKFKRGFGGKQVPQVVAEKYYDSEYFEKEYVHRIKNYKEYIEAANNKLLSDDGLH